MIELAQKRVLVVGLGITGRSLARFLHSRGADLVLTDGRADVDRRELPPSEIHLGRDNPDWLVGVQLVLTSPGIPRASALLRAAVSRGIPVLSEIELASNFLPSRTIAVTGTNGKSTVTTLIGEALKAAGIRTFVGGNLGTPLIDAVGIDHEIAVAEISSFQLEWIRAFKPFIGIHLNLSDDHFERYADLDDYGRTKARLFENQAAEDWAILNRDDPNVWKLRNQIRSRVVGFGSAPKTGEPAVWIENGEIRVRIDGRDSSVKFNSEHLAGRHNAANAMSAAAAAVIVGVETGVIELSLAKFKGLKHRLEFVRELEGVVYIDDSKGTNVGAVVEAIAATRAPIILLAGGMDKGGDYAPLRDPIRRKVRQLILYGAARERMRTALEGVAPIEPVATLNQAVECAANIAKSGDTVLLSPACSSFDQFKDYAERGQIYKELVRSL
jgi:UDP-N-acetylmuramoylalanine--D-glutamate ligase